MGESEEPRDIPAHDNGYAAWVRELSARYRRNKIKADVSVNSETLAFYWQLRHDIVEVHAESHWGSGFFKELSRNLQSELPNTKGLSPRNLLYMKQFYELFPDREIVQRLAAQLSAAPYEKPTSPTNMEIFSIPWGHIMLIINKCKVSRPIADFLAIRKDFGEINHLLKSDKDEPTIGLLICKGKDNVMARYALEGPNQPIGISVYELPKLIPEDFKGSLPTTEEIEAGFAHE